MTDRLQGAYGKITKTDDRADKKFEKLVHVVQEYSALKYLEDCHYIVHPQGVHYETKTLSMDVYDMNLRTWINHYNCCLDCVNHIIYCILCGLIEIQDRGLSHSDIKPGNILLKLEPLTVVIADLGFCSIAKYSKQQRTAPNFREPQVYNDQKHDMYSFGLLFMEMVYNIKPQVYNNYQTIINIIDKKVKACHQDLCKRLVSENRDQRPLAREVLQLLFNKTLKHYKPFKHDFNQYKDDYHIYQPIKKYTKELKLNRGLKGYEALLIYLHHHKIHHKMVRYYICALLIILASVFSQKTPVLNDITNVCQIKNVYKIEHILTKLTNNSLFLKCLFT
jgi:serine/threonine protein kinase